MKLKQLHGMWLGFLTITVGMAHALNEPADMPDTVLLVNDREAENNDKMLRYLASNGKQQWLPISEEEKADIINQINLERNTTTVSEAAGIEIVWDSALEQDLIETVNQRGAEWFAGTNNNDERNGIVLMKNAYFTAHYPDYGYVFHDSANKENPWRVSHDMEFRRAQRVCFDYTRCAIDACSSSPPPPGQNCNWWFQYYPEIVSDRLSTIACVLLNARGWAAPANQELSFWCYGKFLPAFDSAVYPYIAGEPCSQCPDTHPICVNDLCAVGPTSTGQPTVANTKSPSKHPTKNPTKNPTVKTTFSPSGQPTVTITLSPTPDITVKVTLPPSGSPTVEVTAAPTRKPTAKNDSNAKKPIDVGAIIGSVFGAITLASAVALYHRNRIKNLLQQYQRPRSARSDRLNVKFNNLSALSSAAPTTAAIVSETLRFSAPVAPQRQPQPLRQSVVPPPVPPRAAKPQPKAAVKKGLSAAQQELEALRAKGLVTEHKSKFEHPPKR